jgi:hypothetical protein
MPPHFIFQGFVGFKLFGPFAPSIYKSQLILTGDCEYKPGEKATAGQAASCAAAAAEKSTARATANAAATTNTLNSCDGDGGTCGRKPVYTNQKDIDRSNWYKSQERAEKTKAEQIRTSNEMYALTKSAEISGKLLDILYREQAKCAPSDPRYEGFQQQITKTISNMQSSSYDLVEFHQESKRMRMEKNDSDLGSNISTPFNNRSLSTSPVDRESTNSAYVFSPIDPAFSARLENNATVATNEDD